MLQKLFFSMCHNEWNELDLNIRSSSNCMKSVRIRSYFGPYFPAFVLNTERYSVSLCIQSKCGKIQTRIAPNTDTFYAVSNYDIFRNALLKFTRLLEKKIFNINNPFGIKMLTRLRIGF